MQCPKCNSTHIQKNVHRKEKQNHICVDCRRQFINNYQPERGYSDEVRGECLKMYVNGMGFRGIERSYCVYIIRGDHTNNAQYLRSLANYFVFHSSHLDLGLFWMFGVPPSPSNQYCLFPPSSLPNLGNSRSSRSTTAHSAR